MMIWLFVLLLLPADSVRINTWTAQAKSTHGSSILFKRRMELAAYTPILVPMLHVASLYCNDFHKYHVRDLDGLDLFSGEHAITTAAEDEGLRVQCYDKTYFKDESMNFIHGKGFRRAVTLVLRVKDDGCVWAGPECKTWVWIHRYNTGRSALNPKGNTTNDVINANKMVVLLATLICVAYLRNVNIFVEQSSSSLVRLFGPFKLCIEHILWHSARTWLGCFGAITPKPIDIMSNTPSVYRLKRKRPRHKLARLGRKNSNGSVTGKKALLEESSAYPLPFGRAVVKVWKHLMKRSTLHRVFHGHKFHH